jgi:uncharacterized protein YndB with AHSA1/START domain
MPLSLSSAATTQHRRESSLPLPTPPRKRSGSRVLTNKGNRPTSSISVSVAGKPAAVVPRGGPIYFFEAQYQDIVPDQRIITTYEMHLDQQRISVSLTTTEFLPEGSGTTLKYTEQAVFLDGLDNAAQREFGTKMLLDGLGDYLSRQTS